MVTWTWSPCVLALVLWQCYLSWLLRGSGALIDVVDLWGAVLRPSEATPEQIAKLLANASNTTLRALRDESNRHIIEDSMGVVAHGKGQFMLAFSHHVQTSGHWPVVRSVVHGNAKDGVSGPSSYYDNASLSFIYVDRCRRGRGPEMSFFWPKLRPGGRMCGDDVGAKGVRSRLKQFFTKHLPRVLREPPTSWEVTRESADHWCATKL